jgi:CubicO group peptidase (beta-lactamase class C family)
VSGTIAPGDTLRYAIALPADHFFAGYLDQWEIDLAIRILAPDGTVRQRIDGPARGPEVFSAQSDSAGTYMLEVIPFRSARAPGEFELQLVRVEPVARELAARIDQIMTVYDRQDTPGAAVGILQGGKLAFAKGYGMANLEHAIPFRPETISDIGSVSKQITCFGILLLEQQGRLSLDDDIRQYLPEVPDFGTPITIRHLMYHTSGLREIYGTTAIAGVRSGDWISQEDALRMVSRQRELNFPPGEQYLYCNTAYMLLADIISRVSEQPYETWLREQVFLPLGMEDTYVMDEQGELFPNRADSYTFSSDGGFRQIYDNSTVQGAGGIYTTVGDLAKWLDNFRTARVGGTAVRDRMWERGLLNSGDTLDYAAGLIRSEHRGVRRIWHTGSSAGYRAIISYYPDLDMGFLIKSNRADFGGSGIAGQIADFLLAPHFTEPESERERRPRPPRQPAISYSAAELQDFAGRYYSPELGTEYQFLVEAGQLTVRHARNDTFTLAPTADRDVFAARRGAFNRAAFERAADGRLTGVRIGNGRVLRLWMEKTTP